MQTYTIKGTSLEVRMPENATGCGERSITQVDSCSLMEAVSRESDKIVLVMVGLPARGKTYLANKIRRYCSWLGFKTKSFNTTEFRRELLQREDKDRDLQEYFDPSNEKGRELREKVVHGALDSMLEYLVRDSGQIGIFDGTNVTLERQQLVRDRIELFRQTSGCKFQLIWIESILSDEQLLQKNLRDTKLYSPDYQSMTSEEISGHLQTRIGFFQDSYHSIEDPSDSFIRIFDIGKQVVANRLDGYIQGKIVSFLMNIRISSHPIFFSRHGESQYNVDGKIGGDSLLSEKGRAYAFALNQFIHSQPEVDKGLRLWCSTLKRTIETASYVKEFQPLHWRALSEIEVGVCDGMTYQEVKSGFPEEFEARHNDKLRYRYPRGESYLDLIQRLEPVIFALENATKPILVIAHRAVIRCLYAYFMDLPADEVPHISVPLHTIIKMAPRAYGTDVETYELEVSVVDEESDQKLT